MTSGATGPQKQRAVRRRELGRGERGRLLGHNQAAAHDIAARLGDPLGPRLVGNAGAAAWPDVIGPVLKTAVYGFAGEQQDVGIVIDPAQILRAASSFDLPILAEQQDLFAWSQCELLGNEPAALLPGFMDTTLDIAKLIPGLPEKDLRKVDMNIANTLAFLLLLHAKVENLNDATDASLAGVPFPSAKAITTATPYWELSTALAPEIGTAWKLYYQAAVAQQMPAPERTADGLIELFRGARTTREQDRTTRLKVAESLVAIATADALDLTPYSAPPADVSQDFVTDFGPDAMEKIQRAEVRQAAAATVHRLLSPRRYTREGA